MKRTLWRALIVVALLSNVFVVSSVSATVPALDQVTQPNDPAGSVNFTSTFTLAPTIITAPGTYTITYTTVVKNNNASAVVYNPAFTYTLDSALTMVSMIIAGTSGTVSVPVSGTVSLPTKSWRAYSMESGSAVTVTLVATGAIAAGSVSVPYTVTTRIDAFDGAAVRDPWYLRTDISAVAKIYKGYLPLLVRS